MKVTGVLFDLDNTLLDFMRMKRIASDAAARAMFAAGADFPFTEDEAGDILFGEYLQDIEGDQVFARFVKKNHQSRLSLSAHSLDRITAAAVNAYLRAKMLHLEPFAGMRQTLVELARLGLRLGILTDAPRMKAYQRLDAAGLAEHFDFVITATDHGSQKPDPAAFRAAMEQWNVPPSQILMVGDWPERDIDGAKAMGMRTAFAKYGAPNQPEPVDADFILARPKDLLGIFSG